MKKILVLCLAVLALLVWTMPTHAVDAVKKASSKKAAVKGKVIKKEEKKEGKGEKKEGKAEKKESKLEKKEEKVEKKEAKKEEKSEEEKEAVKK